MTDEDKLAESLLKVPALLKQAEETLSGLGAGHAIAIAAIADLLIAKNILTLADVEKWLLAGLAQLDATSEEAGKKALSHVIMLLQRSFSRPN